MKQLPKPRAQMAAIVAQMHYMGDDSLTQKEIGQRLGLNKATVSRLLEYAHTNHLIRVAFDLPRIKELEMALCQKFGLSDAVVVYAVEPVKSKKKNRWAFRKRLAESAARYLESTQSPLTDHQHITISCGATMRELVTALTPRKFKHMRISQLTIESETNCLIDDSPFTLVGLLHGKWGVNCAMEWNKGMTQKKITETVFAVQPLPGTMLKSSNRYAAPYASLRAKVFQLARRADVALVGISACTPSGESGTFVEIMKKHKTNVSWLKKNGVIGELCNRPYDINGTDMFSRIPGLRSYLDGIELAELRRLVDSKKKVIAVAGGKRKANAIRVALQNKYANILITDVETAELICRDR
jgi:DNA-binding transcriptional regulator LsrR (DeoR family)